MSEEQPTFRALSDPTRREILRLLNFNDLTIAQIAANFPTTRAAIKKHLTILEQGGFISATIKGRERVNHLEKSALFALSAWVASFENQSPDRIAEMRQSIATQWH